MIIHPVQLVDQIFRVFEILIILRVVLSWMSFPATYRGFVHFVQEVTDPLLKPFRAVFRMNGPGIDLSPLIFLFVLHMLKGLVISVIAS